MSASQPQLNLTIQITDEQIGFLAYLFPNEDPEVALIKLVERARKQSIRQAEKKIMVLHPGQESEETLEIPVTQGDDRAENPIGQLQELCQKQQISFPMYEFSEIPNGFRCTVQSMGLQGTGEGSSKQEAKTNAARKLLSKIDSRM